MKSPTFLHLAKKKLAEAGFIVRRNFRRILAEPENILDDKTMDEINLSNLINEWILEEDVEKNEAELLLRALALQDVVYNESEKETIENKKSDNDMQTLIAILK